MKSRVRTDEVDRSPEIRAERGENLIPFGVSYLDDALVGIEKEDLVLIGAHSGAGKTELATTIALRAAESGKKAFYFALEASPLEIESRILYKLMCKHFFSDPERPRVELDYANWYYGLLPEVYTYDILAQEEFKSRYGHFLTFYKESKFELADFIREFSEASSAGADLIVIDHAHYFDWGEKTEAVGLRDIITAARDLNLMNQVPVVLISHLRKRDFKTELVTPRLEDFHGSSELYKRSTKVITLDSGESLGNGLIESFMTCLKFRARGEVVRYTAQINFSFKTNSYEREYTIGKSNQKRGSEFEEVARDDMPGWARNARRSSGYHRDVTPEPSVSDDQRRDRFAQSLPYKD